MSSVSPTNQDLSIGTTFSQIKSRVPVPLRLLFTILHWKPLYVCPIWWDPPHKSWVWIVFRCTTFWILNPGSDSLNQDSVDENPNKIGHNLHIDMDRFLEDVYTFLWILSMIASSSKEGVNWNSSSSEPIIHTHINWQQNKFRTLLKGLLHQIC